LNPSAYLIDSFVRYHEGVILTADALPSNILTLSTGFVDVSRDDVDVYAKKSMSSFKEGSVEYTCAKAVVSDKH
jgi:hypothetical protein